MKKTAKKATATEKKTEEKAEKVEKADKVHPHMHGLGDLDVSNHTSAIPP